MSRLHLRLVPRLGDVAGSEVFERSRSKTREYVGGQLVLALERAYDNLRNVYAEGVIIQEYKTKPGVIGHIPEAVIVVASAESKYGHFAHSKWTERDAGGEQLAEIMISAEGLRRSPRDVLGTLVHEAAHGVCHSAGVQDVSRRGQYHNKAFARTAEQMGLIVHEPMKVFGHTNTELPEGELQDILDELTPKLVAYREFDVQATTVASGANRLSLSCRCPRNLQMRRGVYDQGPVYCGVCGDQFE